MFPCTGLVRFLSFWSTLCTWSAFTMEPAPWEPLISLFQAAAFASGNPVECWLPGHANSHLFNCFYWRDFFMIHLCFSFPNRKPSPRRATADHRGALLHHGDPWCECSHGGGGRGNDSWQHGRWHWRRRSENCASDDKSISARVRSCFTIRV